MKNPSEYAGSRKALLLICLCAAAIITFEAIRIWVADYRVHTNRVDQMDAAWPLSLEMPPRGITLAALEKQIS